MPSVIVFDHMGFRVKKELEQFLRDWGYPVDEVGRHSGVRCTLGADRYSRWGARRGGEGGV